MRFNKLLTTSASAIVLTAVAATGAAAQEVTSVDEIIVTAQKREQSLQDVPIVVTSLSQQVLEDAGVRDIKDMQILTPGLTVTSTTSETITTARIRGVGTVGDNPGLESSVGVVIDGVYRPRNGVGFGDLGEMSRIEVLKGPQGTLFGKNTSAGVINIITEAPSFQPGFEGEVTGGNFGAWGVSASATGPLSENIAGRLYVAARQRDGFYDVDTGDGPRTMTEDQTQDFWTARGQLLILPSDLASIRLIADYSKREEFCCVASQIRVGPTFGFINALSNGQGQAAPVTGGSFGPAPGYDFVPYSRTAYSNRDTGQEIEDYGFSAEVNADIESWNATVTSVTAWRSWESVNGMDVDFTGADLIYRNQDGNFGFGIDTLSQELRLAGSTANFDWLIGGFYARENLSRDDSYFLGADYNPYLSFLFTATVPAALGGPNPGRIQCFTDPTGFNPLCAAGLAPPNPLAPTQIVGQGVDDHYSQTSETFAIFTNNTWRVTDAFELTLGLRWTQDEKDLQVQQDNINGNGAACLGALANQGSASPTPTSALGALCLPWSNPFYDNRAVTENFTEDAFSGTFKAAYRLNDSLMIYGSYARGYKGAGYNLDRVQTGVIPDASLYFPAETVDSWELGFKSTLFNRSLLFNATLFDQTFEDFQLNTFLGTAFVVESIPELNSTGVDMDMLWFTPVEGLTLNGGLTYTDTTYGNFTAADLINPSRFGPLSLLPGAQMSFAPEWSVTGGMSYERSLGNGLMGRFNLSAKYSSEYNTGSDLLPAKMQDAFTLVNGRIGFGAEDRSWMLEVWGQNLTDEEYYQVVFNAPLQGTAFASIPYNAATDTQTYNAFLGAPRTWGVTLRVRY
ncbi:TonB-dependent receptor [Brevundimonas sp.]|uniref:TonB-dependent receptor n=1 Tax=Brevundimonas sp. TaxID=1871086 RepID=UPI001DD535FE|nr:TonB-dependent receptor [Brevundimonas sp.]MBA3999673.1 TonB-dependent receptor [Brevundimonas sp.]